jgi:methionyl-tRNA formyltransferase
MRLVFMGTGEICEPTFAAALAGDHPVVGLVTQPDRPVGRKQVLRAPAVKSMAEEVGVPVLQPSSVREEEVLRHLGEWRPNLLVVMAYGQILPPELIALPTRAIINLHASLLPKYRGASCIQAALKNGDPETGWSVIHVVRKLDAGNILVRCPLKIREGETGGELHDRLARLGPEALNSALKLLEQGAVPGEKQDEELQSYAPKLGRADGCLDWSKPADELERLVRAYHPWPGTTAKMGSRQLKIFPPVAVGAGQGAPGQFLGESDQGLEIACGEGSLFLNEVQPEGRRRMTGRELLLGHQALPTEGLK